MKAAMMVYATDLVDEGFDAVLDGLRERGALDGVELAAVYHHARDLYPHNPVHRLHFADGGACFFRPDQRRYERALIQPRRARMTDDVDPLARLVETAGRHGMAPRAWTINLHNVALGEAYPHCAARNVFGDPLLTDLCPANPDVRAYATAVSADIARYGVESIVAESICYMPFDHGFHHERCPYPLPPAVRYLLSVCFCDSCRAAFGREGVDTERLRRWLGGELSRAIQGEPSELDGLPLDRNAVAGLAGGEMRGLLKARERIVSSLVAEVADAIHREGPTTFVFMDSMVADDSGDQAGPLLVDRSWQFGIDLPAVAAASDSLSIMGYSRGQERFVEDVDAYRRLHGVEQPLSLVLRAMPPDCLEPAELLRKVLAARERGVEWIEFYVYGLMRLSGLDWIGAALRAARETERRDDDRKRGFEEGRMA